MYQEEGQLMTKPERNVPVVLWSCSVPLLQRWCWCETVRRDEQQVKRVDGRGGTEEEERKKA